MSTERFDSGDSREQDNECADNTYLLGKWLQNVLHFFFYRTQTRESETSSCWQESHNCVNWSVNPHHSFQLYVFLLMKMLLLSTVGSCLPVYIV